MSDPTVTPTPTEERQDVLTPETRAALARQAFVEAAHWSMQTDEGRRWDAMDDGHPARRWWGDLVERVARSILAAPSPAVSAPDLDAAGLGFHIEDRAGITCVVWDSGGVSPANDAVKSLWAALAAAHAETERLRGAVTNARAVAGDRIKDREQVLRAVMAERDETRAALAALREAAEAARQALTKDFHDGPFVQEAFDILRAALAAAPSETEEGR